MRPAGAVVQSTHSDPQKGPPALHRNEAGQLAVPAEIFTLRNARARLLEGIGLLYFVEGIR